LHDFSRDVFVVQKIEKLTENTSIPAQNHQLTLLFKTAFKNNRSRDNNTTNVPELLQLSVHLKKKKTSQYICISVIATKQDR
jgi:hypothetical protein